MRAYQIILPLLILLLAACDEKIEGNMSGQLPDFEFTTQDHEQLGLNDLKGEWWIASFMYTGCETICPVTTANMKQVQDRLETNGAPIQLVSFTVDPAYDTPEVLKKYAEEQGADLNNWSFLTGYAFDTIHQLSVDAFKVSLQQASPGTGNDQIVHGTNFYLVNPAGEIIKKYDGVSATGKEELMEDLQRII